MSIVSRIEGGRESLGKFLFIENYVRKFYFSNFLRNETIRSVLDEVLLIGKIIYDSLCLELKDLWCKLLLF